MIKTLKTFIRGPVNIKQFFTIPEQFFITGGDCPKGFVRKDSNCYGCSEENYDSSHSDTACNDFYQSERAPWSLVCNQLSFAQVNLTHRLERTICKRAKIFELADYKKCLGLFFLNIFFGVPQLATFIFR